MDYEFGEEVPAGFFDDTEFLFPSNQLTKAGGGGPQQGSLFPAVEADAQDHRGGVPVSTSTSSRGEQTGQRSASDSAMMDPASPSQTLSQTPQRAANSGHSAGPAIPAAILDNIEALRVRCAMAPLAPDSSRQPGFYRRRD